MAGSFEDSLRADNKSIGFEYQDYFALLVAFDLKPGHSIGIEVKDDIHIQLGDQRQILMQLKHSVQKNAANETISLRNLDVDLWKTLYNWIEIIKSKGSTGTSSQEIFISQTEFRLVSNKSGKNNDFCSLLENYKAGKTSFSDIKSHIINASTSTKDNSIKAYVNTVLSIGDHILEEFLKKISFMLEIDDLITRIKDCITAIPVRKTRVELVYSHLASAFRDSKYRAVKDGGRVIISYDEFQTMLLPCVEKGHINRLPRNELEFTRPGTLMNLTFIKQVNDLQLNHSPEDLFQLNHHRLLADSNLTQWTQQGFITSSDVNQIKNNAQLKWAPIYRDCHFISSFPTPLQAGRKCFTATQQLTLALNDSELDTDLANGVFYCLANEPLIGWAHDWQARYKS